MSFLSSSTGDAQVPLKLAQMLTYSRKNPRQPHELQGTTTTNWLNHGTINQRAPLAVLPAHAVAMRARNALDALALQSSLWTNGHQVEASSCASDLAQHTKQCVTRPSPIEGRFVKSRSWDKLAAPVQLDLPPNEPNSLLPTAGTDTDQFMHEGNPASLRQLAASVTLKSILKAPQIARDDKQLIRHGCEIFSRGVHFKSPGSLTQIRVIPPMLQKSHRQRVLPSNSMSRQEILLPIARQLKCELKSSDSLDGLPPLFAVADAKIGAVDFLVGGHVDLPVYQIAVPVPVSSRHFAANHDFLCRADVDQRNHGDNPVQDIDDVFSSSQNHVPCLLVEAVAADDEGFATSLRRRQRLPATHLRLAHSGGTPHPTVLHSAAKATAIHTAKAPHKHTRRAPRRTSQIAFSITDGVSDDVESDTSSQELFK